MIKLKRSLVVMIVILVGAIPSIAKGAFPTLKITDAVTGDTLEVLSEDHYILSQFFLFDRCAPLSFNDILELENAYEIQRGVELLGVFEPFDKLVYYPNVIGRRGIIHYIGLVNASGVADGGSEYDNHWFFANPQTEPYLRQVLFDERVIESPFQTSFLNHLTRRC